MIEKQLDMHSRQYAQQIQAFARNPIDAVGVGTETLQDTICAILPEELRNDFPTTPQPCVDSLTDIIQEELHQAIGTSTPQEAHQEPQTMTYTATIRHAGSSAVCRLPAVQNNAPQKIDRWRTPGRRLLCYCCREAGHNYRRCPCKRHELQGFLVDAPHLLCGRHPKKFDNYINRSSRGLACCILSPSPYPHRSPSFPYRKILVNGSYYIGLWKRIPFRRGPPQTCFSQTCLS